jgi:hypothetical protein
MISQRDARAEFKLRLLLSMRRPAGRPDHALQESLIAQKIDVEELPDDTSARSPLEPTGAFDAVGFVL